MHADGLPKWHPIAFWTYHWFLKRYIRKFMFKVERWREGEGEGGGKEGEREGGRKGERETPCPMVSVENISKLGCWVCFWEEEPFTMKQDTGPGTKSAQFPHSYLLILQTVSIYRCKDNPREGCTGPQSPSLCCEMQYVLISERSWEGTGDNEGVTWWSARQLPTHFTVTLKHLG